MDTLHRKNIDNMTALWRAYGADERRGLWVNRSWPHRVWSESFSGDTASIGNGIPAGKVFACPLVRGTEAFARSGDWQSDTVLSLMWLDLQAYPQAGKTPQTEYALVRLNGAHSPSIKRFVSLCSEGFGYPMDEAVIAKVSTRCDTELVIMRDRGRDVATALLFQTQDTLGIFQLAVPQRFRGAGYARQLMQSILADAQQRGFRYVTLQASEMGFNLYQGLGFRESGKMALYRRLG